MKHLLSIPKALGIVLASLIITSVTATAQQRAYAYNTSRIINEKPADGAAPSIQLMQPAKDSLLFRLRVDNPSNEKLVLFIKDRNNNTLHREVLPATQLYIARYNLQSLEDGDYTFEIRNNKNKVAEKAIAIGTRTQVNRIVTNIE